MNEAIRTVVPEFDPITGPLIPVRADGEDWVVVVEHSAAVGRWCPHQEADLARGSVAGPALKCPLHGFLFEVGSGRGMNCRFRVETRTAEFVDGRWYVGGLAAEIVY
jgi:nitrite reductase/ring-hydroxylating ferredoxin subunit